MKKFVLSLASLAALALLTISSLGQGILFEDNSGATYDTILNGADNTRQDLNLELLLVTAPGVYAPIPIVTLLLSSTNTNPSGSGALGQVYSAAGDISAFGTIYDFSGTEYNLSAYAGDTIHLQVFAWTGNYSSLAAAEQAGDFFESIWGSSQVFAVTLGNSPYSFPADISGVGTIIMDDVPEPTTIALAGLGGLSLLVLRRRK